MTCPGRPLGMPSVKGDLDPSQRHLRVPEPSGRRSTATSDATASKLGDRDMAHRETYEQLVARVNAGAHIAPIERTAAMKTLASFNFPAKKQGAAQSKYNWDEILSGQPVLLVQGKDCDSLKLMGHMAYSQARRREMTIRIVGLDDKGVKAAQAGREATPCKMADAVGIVVQAEAADAAQIAEWEKADTAKKARKAEKKAKKDAETPAEGAAA